MKFSLILLSRASLLNPLSVPLTHIHQDSRGIEIISNVFQYLGFMLLKSRFHLHLPENNCITFCCTRKTHPFYNSDLTYFACKVNKMNFPCVATALAMGIDYILSKPSGDRGRRLSGLHCLFYLT